MSAVTAEVQVLTAEVRVLMVGNRQVTLSVYRQLDTVDASDCKPFGRVRDSQDTGPCVYVIGIGPSGALVRTFVGAPDRVVDITHDVKPALVPYLRSRSVWFETNQNANAPHGSTIAEKDGVRIRVEMPAWDRMIHQECGQEVYGWYSRDDGICQCAELNDAGGSERPRGHYFPEWDKRDDELESDEAVARVHEVAAMELRWTLDDLRVWREWKELPLIVLAGLR